jgi:epoxyqueuosine reductase
MGNRIYGCDDCLAVCPWNKFAVAASETRYAARDDLKAPRLAELALLDDAGFRARFSGQSDQAHRARPVRAQRALCNREFGVEAAGPVGGTVTEDPDPAVADAARWAVERLR